MRFLPSPRLLLLHKKLPFPTSSLPHLLSSPQSYESPRKISSSTSPTTRPSLSSLFSAPTPPHSVGSKNAGQDQPEKSSRTLSSLFVDTFQKKSCGSLPPRQLPPLFGSGRTSRTAGAKPELRKKRTFKPGGSTAKATPNEAVPVAIYPEMVSLIDRLHKDGYLKEANFMKGESFDPSRLPIGVYSQGFLKNAVVRFARDHQEIGKWLSGNHLKEVALLGCPSTDRKTVFAAKSLRAFFSIHEDNVCSACKLKTSCSFVNKKAGRQEKLILRDALLVLLGYSLPNPSLSEHLQLSDEVKFSIHKTLKEVIMLSN